MKVNSWYSRLLDWVASFYSDSKFLEQSYLDLRLESYIIKKAKLTHKTRKILCPLQFPNCSSKLQQLAFVFNSVFTWVTLNILIWVTSNDRNEQKQSMWWIRKKRISTNGQMQVKTVYSEAVCSNLWRQILGFRKCSWSVWL